MKEINPFDWESQIMELPLQVEHTNEAKIEHALFTIQTKLTELVNLGHISIEAVAHVNTIIKKEEPTDQIEQ